MQRHMEEQREAENRGNSDGHSSGFLLRSEYLQVAQAGPPRAELRLPRKCPDAKACFPSPVLSTVLAVGACGVWHAPPAATAHCCFLVS